MFSPPGQCALHLLITLDPAERGWTEETIAARPRMLDELISRGADLSLRDSYADDTPLHLAVRSAWVEGVNLLIALNPDAAFELNAEARSMQSRSMQSLAATHSPTYPNPTSPDGSLDSPSERGDATTEPRERNETNRRHQSTTHAPASPRTTQRDRRGLGGLAWVADNEQWRRPLSRTQRPRGQHAARRRAARDRVR